MEALNKHKAQRNAVDGMSFYGPKTNFSKHKTEVKHHREETLEKQTVHLVTHFCSVVSLSRLIK